MKNSRKILFKSLLLSLLFMGIMLVPHYVNANSIEDFVIVDNRLKKYKGDAKSVVIPDTVTIIDEGAFFNCRTLEEVFIPDSVVSIKLQAFQNCSSLKSIKIPDSVTQLNESIFYNCTSLESAVLSNNIKYLYEDLFRNCPKLTTVVVPDGLLFIGDNAFNNCSSLYSITIPENVTEIGDNAFYKCSNLRNITIPKNTTAIGKDAFTDCTLLSSISIPDTITLTNNPFINTPWLKVKQQESTDNLVIVNNILLDGQTCSGHIKIPSNVVAIGSNAFENSINLKSINIPDNVTSIGDNGFANCSSLEEITLSENLITIGYSAFENCSSIKSITFPKSIETISTDALRNCKKLKEVTILSITASVSNFDNDGCLYTIFGSKYNNEIPETTFLSDSITITGYRYSPVHELVTYMKAAPELFTDKEIKFIVLNPQNVALEGVEVTPKLTIPKGGTSYINVTLPKKFKVVSNFTGEPNEVTVQYRSTKTMAVVRFNGNGRVRIRTDSPTGNYTVDKTCILYTTVTLQSGEYKVFKTTVYVK